MLFTPSQARTLAPPHRKRLLNTCKYSHAPNMCTANSCSSENSKKSAFFWAPPPFCNKKAFLVRPRSGKKEPFRSLGCRFVDQNVALLSHTPCRRPQYCTVAHKRHAQEHRVETGHTAQPLFAPQALTRRRWLAAGSQALTVLLPLLGRLLLSCCVSCCAGPPQASFWLLLIHRCARPTGIISWRV